MGMHRIPVARFFFHSNIIHQNVLTLGNFEYNIVCCTGCAKVNFKNCKRHYIHDIHVCIVFIYVDYNSEHPIIDISIFMT